MVTELKPTAFLPEADDEKKIAFQERPPYRWTREAFMRLAETGFFPHEEEVELLQGEIFPMAPANPYHAGSINPVGRIVITAFGDGFILRTEQPVALGNDTQPQPDVAICTGREADYRHRFPSPVDIVLVIEIADSTVLTDRAIKSRIYALAGIPEYWILNLRDSCLEVYREPESSDSGGQYRFRRVFLPTETVSPLSASTAQISIAELLGV